MTDFYQNLGELRRALGYARSVGRQDAPILSRMERRSSAFSEGFGTHIPLLAATIAQAPPGRVVELGSGHSSTPLIAEMCRAMRREFVSFESDRKWSQAHIDLGVNCTYVDDWDEWHPDGTYAVAFVDSGPTGKDGNGKNFSRTENVRKLRYCADFIVVHDTKTPGYLIGMEDLLDDFGSRWDYPHMSAVTTVVSERREYAGRR